MNNTIELDGSGWRFAPDAFHEGEAQGWHQPDHDVRNWTEVTVPTVFDRCAPGLAGYEGAGWFRRGVRIPAQWQGKGIFLTFGAVNYRACVWVNGTLVGENEDGFLPFECEVSGAPLKFGGAENVVVVEADNTRHAGDVPGKERGWRPYGGILRSVSLVRRPALHLREVRVTGAAGGRLRADARVVNLGEAEAEDVRLEVAVEGARPLSTGEIRLRPGEVQEVAVVLDVESPECWSPDSPTLHTARLTLRQGGTTLETQDVRFGFRSITATGGRLFLNGEPILLLGYNRHEDSPRTDMAVDPATARQDLLRIKQGGANFVRLCHYPHDPSTLDLCDEIGLLVMAEIPLYWWRGHREGEEAHQRTFNAAHRQLQRLQRRDQNHPSLIFWSVSNETEEDRPEVAEGNAELVRMMKKADPSRLVVHVADHWRPEPHFDADDVICVNAYPYMRGRSWGKGEPPSAEAAGTWWRDALKTLHERYPQKPILVTEFGHVAIEGAAEGSAGEAVQAEVLHEQLRNILAAGPFVCGAVVWCWADHAWAEDGWQNYVHTSPFGVVTRSRRAKLALEILEKTFRGTASRPSLFLRRPNLDDLPPLDLPEGYTLRAAQDEDAEPLATVLAGAFPEMTWKAENVRNWLLSDETVKTTFVIEHEGKPVATASARLLPESYPGSGYVHWVGADAGHRGKRLGYLVSLATLHEFVRLGCRDAALETDDFRIPAIKVYLNLGFVPEYRHATHAPRWVRIAPKLEGYLKSQL